MTPPDLMTASSRATIPRRAAAVVWSGLGAVAAGPTVLTASVLTHAGQTPGGRAVYLAHAAVAAVMLGGTAVLVASRRLLRDAPLSGVLRLCGLLQVLAALVAAIGAYAGYLTATVACAAVATLLVGVAAGLVAERMAATPAAPPIALGGVLGGGLAAYWFPALLDAVSRYSITRHWQVLGPDSATAARVYVLLTVTWALLGASAATTAISRGERSQFRVGIDTNSTCDLRQQRRSQLLEVAHLDVTYGTVQVLFDITLGLGEGESVALLGTNGAGKSTLLRAIFGLKSVQSGHVVFAGSDIAGRPAEQLVALGMAQVPGGRGIFPSLTVAENLRLAGYTAGRGRTREGVDRALAQFPPLTRRLSAPAGVLSGGEQQMLALSRAWIMRPRLLAIDELTLGLAPTVVRDLLTFVREVQAEGTALLLVEQSVQIALEVCDRAYFMERGMIRFNGATSELAARPDLLRAVFLQGASAAGVA